MVIQNAKDLRLIVDKEVGEVKITDVHTHLYTPCFNDLLLWGIDELLTYHYLIAETFRWLDIPYQDFWDMSKKQQAELIWRTLFVENSPYSESCRGVLTVMNRLALDVGEANLDTFRQFFDGLTVNNYTDMVLDMAGVKDVVMTNDPFDDQERSVWLNGYQKDPRFKAALRVDVLLNSWDVAWAKLKEWGYEVNEEMCGSTFDEVKRFLADWIDRMDALYMAVSLPPGFVFPGRTHRNLLIENCILPVCRRFNIPFAMMIGVKKLVNSELSLAGDSVGKGDIETVEFLSANYPKNKFMVTMLARENQHELAVAARKFRNLMVFGCWWFLNNPSLIDDITRMRFELLGVSVIPQHSDARVLDQLIYKWDHSRKIIGDALYDKYKDLMDTGWLVKQEDIHRDVQKLFGGNFYSFLNKKL
jgi:hypothetical protein